MEILNFRFVPSVMVRVDKAEILFMSEMAQRHYDLTCRQAAHAGGVLYRMTARVLGDEKAVHELTWREADLLAKITEPWMPELGPRAWLLHQQLHKLLTRFNEEYRRTNPEPKEKEASNADRS